jgi:hypothetical protein
MTRDEFINRYICAFLGALAASIYTGGHTDLTWFEKQPVNDARTLAEAAWDLIKRPAKPSTDATTGNAETAIRETGYIPIT